ncbi:S41 family peptidase [Nevskia ramosa]|uniref:S41 family peptidase n=1 Tax=Nevskia ramosa TaxID=64002 RepID=UPI0023531EBC|nr:S41 family peptidase [Nevskia ramosa]
MRVLRLSVILGLLGAASCSVPPPKPIASAPAISPEIENLVAFSRLYGTVRWFYPGDEAANFDWDRFAVYGVGRVREARSREQLQAVLEELFLPVAPNLRIYTEGGTAPATDRLLPPDPADLQVVAWQHLGAGLGQVDATYKSLRLNREAPRTGSGVGNIKQSIDAAPWRGQKLRLRAAVRTAVSGAGNQAHLSLIVASGLDKSSFVDNMKDRPITGSDWQVYEIEGSVAADATMIFYGAFLRGNGRMWVDAFELQAAPQDTQDWVSLPVIDASFEQPGGLSKWNRDSRIHAYAADTDRPYAGAQSLRVDAPEPLKGLLFAEHAMPGEVADLALGAGLHAQVPLALYSDAEGIWPRDSAHPLEALKQAIKAVGPIGNDAQDPRLRLAGALITWNVFQHFYPYFDVVAVDWAAELPRALQSALLGADKAAYILSLQRLVAASGDGHGNVFWPQRPPVWYPPFRAEWVEDRVVIVRSLEPTQFEPGDVVLSVDGIDAVSSVRDVSELIAGSPQWKRHRALEQFGSGDQGRSVRYQIQRGEQQITADTTLNQRSPVPVAEHAHIAELRPGIWYVDLSAASIDEIRPKLDALSKAEGVIFDLRGYPKSNHEVLRHLLRGPEAAQWMAIPKITRPDHDFRAGHQHFGWNLQPAEPHIGGRVAFLTDGRAISYAETVMAYVEAQKLGAIVGSATAGTNGGIRNFQLPGGVSVVFTGMRVVRHDGARLFGLGIPPTIPVQPTIAGLRAGRDEVLDAGLAAVGGR